MTRSIGTGRVCMLPSMTSSRTWPFQRAPSLSNLMLANCRRPTPLPCCSTAPVGNGPSISPCDHMPFPLPSSRHPQRQTMHYRPKIWLQSRLTPQRETRFVHTPASRFNLALRRMAMRVVFCHCRSVSSRWPTTRSDPTDLASAFAPDLQVTTQDVANDVLPQWPHPLQGTNPALAFLRDRTACKW